MTIIHEKGSELHWKDVRELVVGEYVPSAEVGARLFRGTRGMWGKGTGEHRVWRTRGLEFEATLVSQTLWLGIRHSTNHCFTQLLWEWLWVRGSQRAEVSACWEFSWGDSICMFKTVGGARLAQLVECATLHLSIVSSGPTPSVEST